MKKIFSLFITTLFCASLFADTDIWTVVGSDAAIFGTTWNPSATANDMTLNGVWTLVKKNISLEKTTGDWPSYKICKDRAWDTTYPSGSGNSYYEVTAAGTYNVAFSLNTASGQYTISLVPTNEAEVTLYFVDGEEWGNVNAYAWKGDAKYMVWPGEAMTKTEEKINGKDVYSYTVSTYYEKVIFSNGGSNQSSDMTINTATPYYYKGAWYADKAAVEAAKEITVYYVNTADWETVNAHVFQGDDKYKEWPGDPMTKTEEKVSGKDVYSYTFPAMYGKIIFSNNGSNQTANLDVNEATPYYYDEEWYASTEGLPETFVPTKYYLTGNGNLVGNEKEWNARAVKVKADTYTFENLATGKEYKLKLSLDGTFNNMKNFRQLTTFTTGLYTDKATDLNICFQMAEAGNVTVTYTGEVFTVDGNFALKGLTLKGNTLPTTSVAMTTNSETKKASATINLTNEQVGDGKFYKFIIAFSNVDLRGSNYSFNRDYPSTEGIVARTDSFSFRADFAGDYVVTWDYATNGVLVSFPAIPARKYYVAHNFASDDVVATATEMTENAGVWSAETTISGTAAKKFKIYSVQGPYETWYGALGENNLAATTAEPWELTNVNGGSDIHITPNGGTGNYTFSFNPENKQLNVTFPSATTTAIGNVNGNDMPKKFVKDGVIYILRNGCVYDCNGRRAE